MTESDRKVTLFTPSWFPNETETAKEALREAGIRFLCISLSDSAEVELIDQGDRRSGMKEIGEYIQERKVVV